MFLVDFFFHENFHFDVSLWSCFCRIPTKFISIATLNTTKIISVSVMEESDYLFYFIVIHSGFFNE